MVARRNGRNPQSSIAPSADGAILGKAEGRRPHPVSGWRMAALCRTVPDHEPPTILNVGAGIPDGPGRNAPWTRQGCRVLRTGYAFATMRRSTLTRHGAAAHAGAALRIRRAFPAGLGLCASSPCCRWMPPRRPPPTDGPCGRRPSALPGVAPSADGALGRQGVSHAAAGGRFAGCGQREFRPLRRETRGAASGLRDFLKKNE